MIGVLGVDRVCRNCRFREGYVCRRFPPVPVFSPADGEGAYDGVGPEWPSVKPNEWCGEHMPVRSERP